MQPSISLPRSETSLRTVRLSAINLNRSGGGLLLRDKQVSASASQNIWTKVNQFQKPEADVQVAYLHVQKLEYSWVIQSKYALQDENVRRVNRGRLLLSGVFGKRVYWNFGSLSEDMRSV